MRLCLDTGHLLLEGRSPAGWFDPHASLIRELHLHGTDIATDGGLADHGPLRPSDPWLTDFYPRLRLIDVCSRIWTFSGIIHFEVLSWEESKGSLHTLEVLLS